MRLVYHLAKHLNCTDRFFRFEKSLEYSVWNAVILEIRFCVMQELFLNLPVYTLLVIVSAAA